MAAHENDNSGCLGVIAILLMGGAWIGSGFVAWNWIEPDSFGRVLVFLLVWAVLSWVAKLLVTGVIAILFGGLE